MIKSLSRVDIDVKKWDLCVQSAHNSRIYAMSYYLDSVCAEGTWMALVFGNYEAVMPIPINRRIPFFPRVMLPHFAQQLGIFSAKKISTALIQAFISTIPANFKSVYLQLNEGNPLQHLETMEVKQRGNYVLHLDPDHDTLFSNYARNLRKNIRKASKLNLKVTHLDPTTFIPFYLAHDKSKYATKRKIIDVLGALLPALLDRDEGILYAAQDEDQNILSACLITTFNKRLTYLMANSSPDGRAKTSMHWLIDQIIKEHQGTMDFFDFEGSDIPSIAEFFSFFNAEKMNYPLVRYTKFPFTILS